jgi:membrane-bound lytic murein transglycosylase B
MMMRSYFSFLFFMMMCLPSCIPAFCRPAMADDTKPLAADLVEDGQEIDLTSAPYRDLFEELRTKYNFTQAELDRNFAGITIRRRVLELMDTQWEAQPYYLYYPRLITPEIIRKGREKLQEHKKVLDRIEKEIGVEREIVVAIWGIESKYGEVKGAFDMFQTLNTMFDAYPRRSQFYRGQLVQFLVLCRENKMDPRNIPGSYGGAFGQTQFIPSSFREYAVDFDHDGKRDVWTSVPDVLASIANYLHRFNWSLGAPIYWDLGRELKSAVLVAAYQKGRKGLVPWQEVKKAQGTPLPASPDNGGVTIVGLEISPDAGGGTQYIAGYPNFQAITKWNNSNRYAMAVVELAAKMKE